MNKPDPEIIIDYLNELTERRYRTIKSNVSKITALLKDGYTVDEIKEVIYIKVLEWKNNPKMAMYLRPATLFNPSNFENYINQVIDVKKNPEMYKKHYEKLNNKNNGNSNIQTAFNDIDELYK